MNARQVDAKKLGIVSVFCGAGGLDVGFSQEGFQTLFAADYLGAAVQTFNAHALSEVAVEVDLLKKNSSSIAKLVADRVSSSGVQLRGLVGGPPCQGVSSANNSSSPIDPRNKLFSRYVNLVLKLDDEHSLDFFVFENVPGLKLKKNISLYKSLVRRLGARFNLHERIIDSVDFGVPQSRKRLILVGIHKRLGVTSFQLPDGVAAAARVSVRDAIHGFPEPDYYDRTRATSSNSFHPNHWTMARRSAKFISEKPFETPVNSRSFIRLEWGKPSRTVAYGNREIHLHPDGRRRLSIYEAMQLQGFPSSFRILGNFSEQVTQVSNAVPPPVARAVAKSLALALYSIGGRSA